MTTKYGHFSPDQLRSTKSHLQKSIFFLLLYVDPKTKNEYQGVDVANAIRSLQYKLDGLNSILLESPHVVETMSLLEAALDEIKRDSFDFRTYRKLILDAGSEIMKVKEGD